MLTNKALLDQISFSPLILCNKKNKNNQCTTAINIARELTWVGPGCAANA